MSLLKYTIIVSYVPTPEQKARDLLSHKKFFYAHSDKEMNEMLSKAWRPGATAQVFEATHALKHTVKASERKGVFK